MKQGRYFASVLGTAAVLLGIVAAFNYALDPLGIWHAFGSGEERPAATAYARLKKTEDIKRLKPDVLITGTSRAETAFDPGSRYFPSLVAYNAALAASSIREHREIFTFAQNLHPLKKAVITLDFFAFDGRRLENKAYDPDLWSEGALHPIQSFFKTYGLVISLEMITASFRHLRTLRHPERYGVLLPNGRIVNRDMEGVIARDGAAPLFALPPNAESIGVTNFGFAYTDRPGDTTFQHLEAMLDLAREKGTEVVLLIPPVHAAYLRALDQSGMTPVVTEWKRRLVEIIRVNAKKYHAAPYPLWDFAYHNSLTDEAVPAMGDKTARMQWFWDSNHAKPELGDIVLHRALGMTTESQDFGRNLIDIKNAP